MTFVDTAGVPLASSKLCTYAAGTSTPLATYTDSTAGTPNANPIVLDSAGRAQVWIAAALYKFVLRTGGDGTCSTGSVAWSSDNISDVSFLLANFIKTTGTASMISTLATPTGAVSRTQLSKNNDVLSVKDFGAVGDGSTDDTAAINLAMAQSIIGKGSTPGVCIFFPDGIYRITAALSYTHTICMIGSSWRLKYTAGGTINAVLSIIGDPVNAYAVVHTVFIEGSIINGAILDGQGHATNGLTLQGVVSSQISQMRVTNVISAGVSCFWCQQTTFDHLQVSADFEAFSTTPQYGIIIDNISSANILNQVNIDHVSVDGIWLKYGLNTMIIGGTTEGNGGWGVRCDGAVSPFRQCYNNTFLQVDVEANTAGDYLFGFSSFFNSVYATNSSSNPGIVFNGDSHYNIIAGGAMGGGSNATAGTYGNAILGIGSFSLTDPVWTDLGSNRNEQIRNQSTGVVTSPSNNYNVDSFTRFIAGASRLIETYTPSATFADFRVGNPAVSWLGLLSQDGQFPQLVFNNASPGFCLQSELTYRGTSTSQMCVVAGNIGFGSFNTTPAYKFHFKDATATTAAFQNGAGQGGAHVLKFLAAASTPISEIENSFVGGDGSFNGATGATGAVATVVGCGASAVTGGGTGGIFTVTTTGTCTAVVTIGSGVGVATHGWNCSASATTGPLGCIPIDATTFRIKGTTTSGDVVSFHASKY